MTLIIFVAILLVILSLIGLSLYESTSIMTSRQHDTAHNAVDVFCEDCEQKKHNRLTKTLPFCIGFCVILWLDLTSGDLLANNDQSEIMVDGNYVSPTKNTDNQPYQKRLTRIFYALWYISFPIGWAFLTYKEITAPAYKSEDTP